MEIKLSDQCVNELCFALAQKVFFDDFEESLVNHYLTPNNIVIPDDRYKGFLEDVYELFCDYHDYDTSWDSALDSAMDNLIRHGDYVIHDCCECDTKVILRGDDDLVYTNNEQNYCPKCFAEHFSRCQKCLCDVDKRNNPILVHGHYYCNNCATELLTHLMQPDIPENK